MVASEQLQDQCELLRSLHRPGDPLLLPNVWDAATARAVVAAGFPVVATTSWGVAASLGFGDNEEAPVAEMLAAAGRISRSVDVPVSVDAEAGYGMEPDEVVAALLAVGAAGCNLEDTDHGAGKLRDPVWQATWLKGVRESASADDYPLVVNARVDNFLGPFIAEEPPGHQFALVQDAARRANAYLEAGADCVYPVALWERDAVDRFMSEVHGPVNLTMEPQSPPPSEFAALGAARVSWAIYLHVEAMAQFEGRLSSLRSRAPVGVATPNPAGDD